MIGVVNAVRANWTSAYARDTTSVQLKDGLRGDAAAGAVDHAWSNDVTDILNPDHQIDEWIRDGKPLFVYSLIY